MSGTVPVESLHVYRLRHDSARLHAMEREAIGLR